MGLGVHAEVTGDARVVAFAHFQAVRDGPDRDRTCDLGIKSPLLYQLSDRPGKSGFAGQTCK